MAKTASQGRVKRRERKNVHAGIAHISATFNNTHVTITDPQGNVISWSTCGHQGFKGSRKSTPYAAQVAADHAARQALEHGMKTLEVRVRVRGPARVSISRVAGGRICHYVD